ncbi:DUF169 domain-containing protein [Paraclostridium benzoelyticum]|uniref:DUF169 domain-containing protein n=1 Tax=Paraclostridium benzoelyticum TaxID=1629550 RepID=UPI0031CD4B0F
MNKKLKTFLACLNIDRKVVGVKFLFTKEEYDKVDTRPSKTKLSYCMMVNVASSGRSIKVREEHFWCSSSARAFGIKEIDDKITSGREYYSYGLYNELGNARKVFEEMIYLNHKIYGIELRPIEEFKEKPHVVIIISQPYDIMRIVQGYSYKYGYANQIKFAGNQGLCSELTIRPYMNNDINISLLCSNTRHSCNWKSDEMGIGIPYTLYEDIMDGVINTMNYVEPDYRKEFISSKLKEDNLEVDVNFGENYYDSCLGVAKLDK